MASFSIENFGCRATEADAAAIRAALLENGFALAAGHASADFVVLNSCTVTAAADSQTREAVRKIHAANPAARIVVTGCYAQRAPEEIAAIGGVAWVIGNSHQAEIPRVLQETPAPKLFAGEANSRATPDFIPLARLDRSAMSLERGHAEILVGDIFEETAVPVAPAAPMAAGHTRPILKIQDGCNNRCSYCVIPFVRGRSRSLPPDGVVGEVRRLVAGGVKEIVLSGINLGSYGRDLTPRAALAEVVRRILAETELEQLRFSSIEPQDVTEDFAGLAAASGRIAPHFHVPLQSGSDSVLRAMHRWYRTEHYAERIALDSALASACGHRRGHRRGLSGRGAGGFRSHARIRRAAAVHIPARIFILGASGNRSRKTWLCRAAGGDSRARPGVARARRRKIRRLSAPRKPGGRCVL